MEKFIQNTNDEYHNGPGIGSHMLIDILKSPRTFYQKHILRKQEPDTDAFRFGRIVHKAILEPEIFKSEFLIKPKFDRRTKQGKADEEAFLKTVPAGALLIEPDEASTLTEMIEAVKSHPKAANLLKRGVAENSGYWTDKATGIQCRCRPDFIVEDDTGVTVVDLKTTRSVNKYSFVRDVIRYNYFIQAAYYLEGVEQILKKPTNFVWLAIEKKFPYEVALHAADETVLGTGENAFRKALRILKECKDKNHWPFMYEEFQNLSMPDYMLEEWADEEEGEF